MFNTVGSIKKIKRQQERQQKRLKENRDLFSILTMKITQMQ